MDMLQDKANKLINDVLKKKIKVSKSAGSGSNEQIKQDSFRISDLSNACFYCSKVFFGSEFLMKHILRRHSKELILLYKNCLKSETNNNASDTNTKYLLSFFEKEFVALKNELKVVQVAVAGRNVDHDQAIKQNEHFKQQESACNINENEIEVSEDKTETHSNELQVLKEKVCDLESNIECLHNKLEEMNNVLKIDVLSKQSFQEHIICNNEKVLKAQELQFLDLGQTLLNDLQSVLSNQLCENNKEWTSQISELKDEIKRIDCVVNEITKQVSSPDYIQKVIDEKFGPQLKIFLGGMKNKGIRTKSLKSKSRISGTKMNCSSVDKVSKFGKNMNASMSMKHKPAVPCLSAEEIDQLFHEKLAYFDIKPNTSKISRTEFNEKIQLINCEKESLKMKYPNFSEIYNSINMFADSEAKKSKFLHKKSHKIRFSEPLVSSVNGFNNSALTDEDFHDKIYPLRSKSPLTAVQAQKYFDLKCERHVSTETEEHPASENEVLKSFADDQASGDCSYSFLDRQNTSFEEALESTPVKFAARPIQISSPIEGTQCTRKTESVFSKNCNKTYSVPSCSKLSPDWASAEDQKKSDHTMKEYAEQDKVSFAKDLKKLRKTDCNHSSNGDYFDDMDSLQSLSSWEGED